MTITCIHSSSSAHAHAHAYALTSLMNDASFIFVVLTPNKIFRQTEEGVIKNASEIPEQFSR